jgi:hypothetical protein
MTTRETLRRIHQHDKQMNLQVIVEQGRGSHKNVTVGSCQTTIPFHQGEDLGRACAARSNGTSRRAWENDGCNDHRRTLPGRHRS